MGKQIILSREERKQRFIRILLVIFLLIINAGCGKASGENKIQRPEDGDLSIYNSPYTYGEKLEDGTYNFYIYAAPVQWKCNEGYQRINNCLKQSEKVGYEFENSGNQIKTYFPSGKKKEFRVENGEAYFCMEIPQISAEGKEETCRNIYGEEKEAICYPLKNGGLLYAYPIYSGIHFECVYSDGISAEDTLTLEVEKQQLRFDAISDEYLQFFQKGMKILLYQPFLRQREGELQQLQSWKLKKNGKEETIQVTMSKLPKSKKGETHLEFSLLWDVEAMPDSTVYEKKDENVFCARSTLVGEGKTTGIGQHYLRYRFNYFYQINPEDILEAEYNVKNLNGSLDTGKPALHEPLVQWSSTRLCWDARVAYGEENQSQGVTLTEDGWYSFDITDFAKKAVDDYSGMTESLGSVMICEEGYAFLATSDNSEFIPYIKLHLKNPPEYFIDHESINEVDW